MVCSSRVQDRPGDTGPGRQNLFRGEDDKVSGQLRKTSGQCSVAWTVSGGRSLGKSTRLRRLESGVLQPLAWLLPGVVLPCAACRRGLHGFEGRTLRGKGFHDRDGLRFLSEMFDDYGLEPSALRFHADYRRETQLVTVSGTRLDESRAIDERLVGSV